MAVTRSMTKRAPARKSSRKKSTRATKKYWKANSCWSRASATGAPYVVCTGSKGEKGIYKKKGRKSRKSRKSRK